MPFPDSEFDKAYMLHVGMNIADKAALLEAGFTVLSEKNRHGFAREFFAEMQSSLAAAGGPPPLGLHIVMGEDAPKKLANMINEISLNRIAPVELIAG